MSWDPTDYAKDGIHDRDKRINHAAAIIGGMLIVHGGYNQDEDFLYDQFLAFDLRMLNQLNEYYLAK